LDASEHEPSWPNKITRLIVRNGRVATVNSGFELTVGLSANERPTVRKTLSTAADASLFTHHSSLCTSVCEEAA